MLLKISWFFSIILYLFLTKSSQFCCCKRGLLFFLWDRNYESWFIVFVSLTPLFFMTFFPFLFLGACFNFSHAPPKAKPSTKKQKNKQTNWNMLNGFAIAFLLEKGKGVSSARGRAWGTSSVVVSLLIKISAA